MKLKDIIKRYICIHFMPRNYCKKKIFDSKTGECLNCIFNIKEIKQ